MSQSKEDILIISHFSGGENPECRAEEFKKHNNRFNYIADRLGKNNSVHMLTSAFFHTQKKHIPKLSEKLDHYTITYIKEPGYSKNVCIKRFYSHYIYGRNIKKYLYKLTSTPKVIYCSVPSLSGALAATKYAKKKHIPLIIDVQDLWPEAFKIVFNPPLLGRLIYFPLKEMADYIYKNATKVIAVSETYCKRAESVRNERTGESIYLGTSFEAFDEIPPLSSIKEEKTYILIYIGTLGHSYDLKCAIEAYGIAKEHLSDVFHLKFWVLGDGPLQEEFQEYSQKRSLDVEFKGRLDYSDMVGYLKMADIALNPIVGKAAQSIINKHADYAAAGLPVVSTQDSEEYKKLLTDFQAGFTCINGDVEDMAEKICFLVKNDEIRQVMAVNSRKMGETLFNRDRTYDKIENIIINIKK